MGQTEMSKREPGLVELLVRVKSRQLRVVDAAGLMRSSCRQAKRLWKGYREEGGGTASLESRSPSNTTPTSIETFISQEFVPRFQAG